MATAFLTPSRPQSGKLSWFPLLISHPISHPPGTLSIWPSLLLTSTAMTRVHWDYASSLLSDLSSAACSPCSCHRPPHSSIQNPTEFSHFTQRRAPHSGHVLAIPLAWKALWMCTQWSPHLHLVSCWMSPSQWGLLENPSHFASRHLSSSCWCD